MGGAVGAAGYKIGASSVNGALALLCSLIATGLIMRPLEIGVKMRPPFCQV